MSASPGNFRPSALRLRPTALRSDFDLLALRARCKSKPRASARRLQGGAGRASRNLRRLPFGRAELALLVTCSKGKKIHRAGGAFVPRTCWLSASAYSPQARLRPTRAPCSVQGETYAAGHGQTRGERRRKLRSLRLEAGEILWISPGGMASVSRTRSVEACHGRRGLVPCARCLAPAVPGAPAGERPPTRLARSFP